MGQRLPGLIALSVAGIAVLAASAMFKPDVAGEASAAGFPAPPPVGSCVDLGADITMSVVDCTGAHDGEISVAVSALDPQGAGKATPGRCEQAVRGYLGGDLTHAFGGLSLDLIHAGTVVVGAPPRDRIGKYGWSVCVLTAHGTRYVGTVDSLPDPAQIPPALGACRLDTTPTSCDEPHDAQQLASAGGLLWGTPFASGDAGERALAIQSSLQTDCTQVAASLTGAADPTYAGGLSIDVDVSFSSEVLIPSFQKGKDVAYDARCVVTSTGRPLVHSVLGLGDDPLPLG